MKLLLIDEDVISVPQIMDLLKQGGHEVVQVTDWKQIQGTLQQQKFDGILLDLMIPAIDLPVAECDEGYTSGVFLYEHYVYPNAKTVPFVLYTSADLQTSIVERAINTLKKWSTFKGAIEKSGKIDPILEIFKSQKT